MGNERIKIIDFEPKKGKRGEYTRFDTSTGWKSCFDKDYSTELKKECGNEVVVGIKEVASTTGGEPFFNIVRPKDEDSGGVSNEVKDITEEVANKCIDNLMKRPLCALSTLRYQALTCAINVHVNAKIVYTPEQIITMAKIFLPFIEEE